jgi:hypothetical protein
MLHLGHCDCTKSHNTVLIKTTSIICSTPSYQITRFYRSMFYNSKQYILQVYDAHGTRTDTIVMITAYKGAILNRQMHHTRSMDAQVTRPCFRLRKQYLEASTQSTALYTHPPVQSRQGQGHCNCLPPKMQKTCNMQEKSSIKGNIQGSFAVTLSQQSS